MPVIGRYNTVESFFWCPLVTKLDPSWALYLKDNPYALVALALVCVVAVFALLMKHKRRDLVNWPLRVVLVIALLVSGAGLYVIVTLPQRLEVAPTEQRPAAAPASSAGTPLAPKNVQIVQGNNNTVISQ